EQPEPVDHPLARNEQAAEQELREDERGQELDRLELGARERGDEQSERHAEQRVAHGERDHDRDGALHVEAEQPERDRRGDGGLERRQRGEREAVAGEQVELRERQRHQPLERPRRPLAQHRDRGDDEHRREREDADHRRPDAVERRRLTVEEVAEQRHEERRYDEEERERARVAPQLPEDASGRGERRGGAHGASTSARNAASRRSSPVAARSSAGVQSASRRPSRRRSSVSQRSASSITCEETSRVVPVSAIRRNVVQRSRRSTGSRPTVGSSSTSSSGSPSSAAASDARDSWPPEKVRTTRSASGSRSTAASDRSIDGVDARRSRAK